LHFSASSLSICEERKYNLLTYKKGLVMKKINLFFLTFLILVMFLFNAQKSFSQSQNETITYGEVIKIVSEKDNSALQQAIGGKQTIQTVIVQITRGDLEGRKVKIENQLTSNPVYDIRVKKGDPVVLTVDKSQKNYDFYISDIQRFPIILVLAGLALLALILFSGFQGVKLIFSIVLSFLLLYFASLTIFFKGLPFILVFGALAVSIILIFVFVTGRTFKSLASALSTITALIFEWLILLMIFKIANISGNWDETGVELYSRAPNLDVLNLTILAFLIVSTGIIMDISSSIVSSITDLKKTRQDIAYIALLKESLIMAKEKLGARINTLFFFFLGINLPFLILLHDGPFVKVINFQSMFLVLGTFLSIFITIVFSAFISCLFGLLAVDKAKQI